VAVKEHDHRRRASRIESWRDVQEHAVVTEGFRFPENLAADTDVAPVALRTSIQERPARRRHHAVIGNGAVSKSSRLVSVPKPERMRERAVGRGGASSSSDASRTPALGLGFG
jgi:hypothetical protein